MFRGFVIWADEDGVESCRQFAREDTFMLLGISYGCLPGNRLRYLQYDTYATGNTVRVPTLE